jgi:hypothetical protein
MNTDSFCSNRKQWHISIDFMSSWIVMMCLISIFLEKEVDLCGLITEFF